VQRLQDRQKVVAATNDKRTPGQMQQAADGTNPRVHDANPSIRIAERRRVDSSQAVKKVMAFHEHPFGWFVLADFRRFSS
jgi:hypothetical protein